MLIRAVLSALLILTGAAATAAVTDEKPSDGRPILALGPGDSVAVQVYGQPDMTATLNVSDDGTIPVALVGPVKVAGLSPSQAATKVENALREGKFLLDPHVSITVTLSRSQRISVLGEVTNPGRYAVESKTSILDLLAQAGGLTPNGADVIYILRTDESGSVARLPIDLRALTNSKTGSLPTQEVRGGDSIYVPKAEQFSIIGEVATPSRYRIEPGMTVLQGIAKAGGVTPRGSERRVEIRRKSPDGSYKSFRAKLNDTIAPDDIIRVKESIF